MASLNDLAEGMLSEFEAKDRAREETLKLSRSLIRNCSASIRSVHRGDLPEAERYMGIALSTLKKIRDQTKDQPVIRYAGFVDDAEQEYAEARNVYSIITRHEILSKQEVGVDTVNYLSGLGDVTGELRRHILDLIRQGRPAEGEYFLDVMEEIYRLLMLFDYPDAITRGLRRKSDLARSMLEKTRGDLTNAIEMAAMAGSIHRLEDKLKEAGPRV